MQLYLSSAYLAPVQYYTKLLSGAEVYIEQNENYQKQSYRNRCNIVSANGVLGLSIPVIHNSVEKIPIKDVRIADHGNWRHIHWNAILSAYNSSPFFEYYQDDFYPFYHKKYTFLFDFNEELFYKIIELLDIDKHRINYTSQFVPLIEGIDMRNSIHPKAKHEDIAFAPQAYYQVYLQKFGFVANMSIIDLLFNMGNESIIVLKNSCKY